MKSLLHCPLALASAVSFLLAAGLAAEHGGFFGLLAAAVCFYLGLVMLRERDAVLVEKTLNAFEAAIVAEVEARSGGKL